MCVQAGTDRQTGTMHTPDFTFPWSVNKGPYWDDTVAVADVHKDILSTVQTLNSTR